MEAWGPGGLEAWRLGGLGAWSLEAWGLEDQPAEVGDHPTPLGTERGIGFIIYKG